MDNMGEVNIEKRRAAIYCRVSTYEQAQGNISSLDGQEEFLKEFCRNKGWEIFRIYRDTKSGKSLERDKIQELLNDAEDKKFDVIVATKLDRLSRSIKDFLELDSRVNALNIDIVTTTQQIDTTSPGGKMQRNMLMIFAEFEREIISERTREKLYFQAQKGYWGGGHLPLGYDSVDKKLVINEEEAKIVKRIFWLYNSGKSSVYISDILNREGYKTKERKSKGKIISDKYTKDSVLRILKNNIYTGLITIKVTKIKGKILTKPQTETFKGLHTPIIDTNTFNLAQNKLQASQKNKYTEYQGSPLILLQKLVCGSCGASMSTTFTTKQNSQRVYGYKCISKSKKGTNHCSAKDIPALAIENFVLSLVQQIGSSELLFDSVFEQFLQNDDSEQKMLEAKLMELQKNLSDIKIKSKRLLNVILQNDKLEHLSLISDQLGEFDAIQKNISKEIEEVKKKIADRSANNITKEEMRELFKCVPDLLKELDKEDQRKLIDFIINEIRWYLKKGDKEGEIEIFFRGNGHLKHKWANNVNPSDVSSRFCLDWLRG